MMEVDKLELSLDELIHLNAQKNKQKKEMELLKSYATSQNSQNGSISSRHPEEENKLPVHQRLGWKKFQKITFNNYTLLRAKQSLVNARRIQKRKHLGTIPNTRISLANPIVKRNFRHSIQSSLTPHIQIAIMNLSASESIIDQRLLNHLNITPHVTDMTTHERFSTND